ncbi:hypothetical protein NGM37_31020, partial [Streptomyces sp. TRM76130]|nr:hypothetical protein [Streptomyces sp. TRM76130]
MEETGPHFFDEDPADEPAPAASARTDQPGSLPGPAPAWGADPARQAGPGAGQEQRPVWPSPQATDPRVPRPSAPADGTGPDGPAAGPSGRPEEESGSTVLFRRPGAAGPASAPAPAPARASGTDDDPGTMTFRAVPPHTARRPDPAQAQTPAPAQAAPR